MTTSQTSEGKVTTPVRRTLRAGRFALLLLVWLFSAGPLGAQQRWLRQHTELQLISRPVLNSTYTFQKSVGQFLEEAKAAHPQNRYPVQIQLAVGYPLQADGRVNMTAEGPPFPPRGSFNLTASPLLNHAGVAMVFTGLFYSNGRLYGSMYKWKGGISWAESGGSSFTEARIAAARAGSRDTTPFLNIDLTGVVVKTAATANRSDLNGNATVVAIASWNSISAPPVLPPPTGSLALSKPVQRSGTTILVTPSTQLQTALSVQRRTGVAPPYSPGQNIGPTKPSFGTEVATDNNVGVAQTADVPDAVVYYALFALGGDNNWYFLDSKTLTPYGYVAGFDVLSLDTRSTLALTGLNRRTRADKTYGIALDTVGGSQILTRLPRDPAHDAADHEMELWATGFSAPNTGLANQGFQPGGPVFNAAPPGSILKGTHNFLLGQPAISLGGLQRPPETPYALDIVPWSRPVTTATGTASGVQLSSPVRLTVYPVAGFELVSGIIDLRRGVCRNRGTQGENIALPGPDVELDVNVTMQVLRPYPHSRVILVAQDPNGALLKVAEVDNRMSPSDATFEMTFNTLDPFYDGTGNYTFYLMAETPVDTAMLAGAGLPGYSEPTTPGYGWVKIGTVTFWFRGEGG
jgi:hypothetical protein